ncbi:nicotinic acid mononucleotide adenyltransferase [Leptobacterium flavescens]|uniref:Nicotinic acid mononucleotide adenyltransferase n=1 Tax=Leptobacterium flavescens TaxID=472055 RepID=A0A6P0URR8_9FLAO|nr:nicotinic acid mononucleotide adenyltransferase [Leptobacterium flavescens]NER13076.1 nicotinic acid mononucleotide adenyltransferase [Leptobacterium flavescens]
MKNLILIFAMLFTATLMAQNDKPLLEKEGDMVKATYYHDNGEIAQIGFYKDGKVHGKWKAYNLSGKKIAMGQYENGKKIGKWFFWTEDGTLNEVDYNDSRIVNVTKWKNSNPVVINK